MCSKDQRPSGKIDSGHGTECLKEQKGRVELMQFKKRFPWGQRSRAGAETGERSPRQETSAHHALLACSSVTGQKQGPREERQGGRSGQAGPLASLWSCTFISNLRELCRLPDQKDHAGRDSAILRVAFGHSQACHSAKEVEDTWVRGPNSFRDRDMLRV